MDTGRTWRLVHLGLSYIYTLAAKTKFRASADFLFPTHEKSRSAKHEVEELQSAPWWHLEGWVEPWAVPICEDRRSVMNWWRTSLSLGASMI